MFLFLRMPPTRVFQVGGPKPYCLIHTKPPGKYAKYFYCAKNLCDMLNVVCDGGGPENPLYCTNPKECNPQNGRCLPDYRAPGVPCKDSTKFYSFNDTCDGMGNCRGLINMCTKEDETCSASNLGDCVDGAGFCQWQTGRCKYNFKPDDTACDDGRPYTVGDQCRKGLCIGHIVQLCKNVPCERPAWDCCHEDPGDCIR